ncbi:hypothetical protein MD484_g3327, partial [Candolleomyces efflorescens]
MSNNNGGYGGPNHQTINGPYFNSSFKGNYVNGDNVTHNYSAGTHVNNIDSIQNANFGTNYGTINQGGNIQGRQPPAHMPALPPHPYQGGYYPSNSYGPPPDRIQGSQQNYGPASYPHGQPQRAHTDPHPQSHRFIEGSAPQRPQQNYETNPYLRMQQGQTPPDYPPSRGHNEAYPHRSQQNYDRDHQPQQQQHPSRKLPQKAHTLAQPRSRDENEANWPQRHDNEYTEEPQSEQRGYDSNNNHQPPPHSRDIRGPAALHTNEQIFRWDESGNPVLPLGSEQQRRRKETTRPHVNDHLPQVREEDSDSTDDEDDSPDPTGSKEKDKRHSKNPFKVKGWKNPFRNGN